MKFYYVTNIFDLHIFDNETAAILIFLEIFSGRHFFWKQLLIAASLLFSSVCY